MKFSRLLATSTAVGALLLTSTAAWAAGVSVTKVRIGEHPTKTRIVLDVTGKPLYQYTLSSDRRQLFIDLPETQWDTRAARSLKRSKFIRGYSYADGRLTIETTKPITVSKALALRPHGGKGNRLFFDLADAPAYFKAPAPTPAPVAQVQPDPPAPEAAPVEPVTTMEPAAVPDQMAQADAQPQDASPWGDDNSGSTRSRGGSAGPYFRADLGWAFSGNADIKQAGYTNSIEDIGDTPVFNLGLGYQVNDNFRTDVTVSYLSGHEISATKGGVTHTADITAITGMVNGYIDIPLGNNMVPYIGFGVGASQNTLGDVARSGTTTVKGDESIELAYQGMVGVGFMADRNWTIDLGYRYLNAGALDSAKTTTTGVAVDDFNGDLIDHQVLLGARYGW